MGDRCAAARAHRAAVTCYFAVSLHTRWQPIITCKPDTHWSPPLRAHQEQLGELQLVAVGKALGTRLYATCIHLAANAQCAQERGHPNTWCCYAARKPLTTSMVAYTSTGVTTIAAASWPSAWNGASSSKLPYLTVAAPTAEPATSFVTKAGVLD